MTDPQFIGPLDGRTPAVYNNRLQPCRINVNSSGTLLSNCADVLPSGNFQDFKGNYSAGSDNGNMVGFTGSGQQNFNRSYGYDSLNRIQTMSAPGDQCSGLSWSIDAWGNRTAQTATGGSCYSPNVSVTTQNRLSGAPYQYDAAGNLTNDGNHTYTYDAENRVTTVDGGATATYVYDAFGNRAEKTVNGLDNEYIYDNDGDINTVLGNGTLERMYVYLNGLPLAEYFENTTYFMHADHLGSTRLLTRLDRTVREWDDYYPFGEQIPPTGGTAGSLKFTGKERDSESGLDDFEARHYSSALGRFMQPDEFPGGPVDLFEVDDPASQALPYADINDPQSLNKYSYTYNNPLRYVDPNGHGVWDFLQGAGNAFGSDFFAGAGRQDSPNADYQAGQNVGDAVAMDVGALEALGGGAVDVASIPLDTVGVGEIIQVGATAATLQGASAVVIGGTHLLKAATSGPKAADAPGVTAGGQATDKYGHKQGPSGKTQVNQVDHSTVKGAKDAARAQGKRAPVKHASPKKGQPHFHSTDEQGKKIPCSTHHNCPK